MHTIVLLYHIVAVTDYVDVRFVLLFCYMKLPVLAPCILITSALTARLT